MSPETRVRLPEIHSHVTRNFIECLNLKKSNILGISQEETRRMQTRETQVVYFAVVERERERERRSAKQK